ncbi:MAG TPA: biotin/lipoyl-containing protein, partial [Caulobacteraceae bacterium]|nr:biotin/lipoyl-containing protein [Caulobacteraceae bacterium]
PDFVEGQATTAFIDRHFSAERLAPQPAPVEAMALAAALLAQGAGKAWRSNDWSGHAIRLGHLDAETLLQVHGENGDWTIGGLAKPVRLTLKLPGLHEVRWSLDGRSRRARYLRNDPVIEVDLGDTVHRFEDLTYAPPRIAAPAGQMRAPMSGTVVAVHVKPGDVVARGQVLMVLEAMKMEHQIIANADGVVASVAATQGAQVAGRTILVTLRDAGEPAP